MPLIDLAGRQWYALGRKEAAVGSANAQKMTATVHDVWQGPRRSLQPAGAGCRLLCNFSNDPP